MKRILPPKLSVPAIASCFLAVFVFTAPAQVIVPSSQVVGAYNPAGEIDATAPSSSSTVAGFTSAVSTAFTDGKGAVWNFDTDTVLINTTYHLDFAADKRLTLTADRNISPLSFASAGFTSDAGNDRRMFGVSNGVTDRSQFSASLALSGAGLAPDEQVVEIGFAALNRTTSGSVSWTVTATLDDSSTIVLTDSLTRGTINTDNTHFGIAAPTGKYITNLSVVTDDLVALDDFGFITAVVPEPSTSLLVMTAAGLVLIQSRSRRARKTEYSGSKGSGR